MLLFVVVASAFSILAVRVWQIHRFGNAVQDVQESLNRIDSSTPPHYDMLAWQEAVIVTGTAFANTTGYDDTKFSALDELARTLRETNDPEKAMFVIWRFIETKEPSKSEYVDKWKPVFLNHLERARSQPQGLRWLPNDEIADSMNALAQGFPSRTSRSTAPKTWRR